MTSIYQNTLAIPENTVQGSGGYTVPANKYAEISYHNLVSGQNLSTGDNNNTQYWVTNPDNNNTANTNIAAPPFEYRTNSSNGRQFLIEGDVVTTQINAPINASRSVTVGSYRSDLTNGIDRSPYSRLLINAVVVSQSTTMFLAAHDLKSTSTVGTYSRHSSIATVGWSVAEFPIPKNNLPLEAQEGN